MVTSKSLVNNIQNKIDPNVDGNGDGYAPIGHRVTIAGVTNRDITVSAELVIDEGYTFKDVYDGLITSYKELDKVGNATIIVVKSDMEQVSNNHFMSLLDEYGCTRLEKIMNITYEELPSLETRRLNIIAKANNTLPYTIYNLKRKIASLLGNDGFDGYLQSV